MVEIPADVMAAADTQYAAIGISSSDDFGNFKLAIARGILAERERCAKVAENVDLFTKFAGDFEGNQIAAAIRSGE